MKLSTKARYAIIAMMDLALHENRRPVTLSDISRYQGISLSYLEQLFAKLRSHGLVKGVRGPGGGYRLARPAEEVSIAEIVGAINGTEWQHVPAMSDDDPEVQRERELLDGMWGMLSERLLDFLANQTLAEFVRMQSGAPSMMGRGVESEDRSAA